MPGVQKPHCTAPCATKDGRERLRARVAGEALDRRQRAAVAVERELQAGGDGAAVDEDGAGAAFALAAAELGAGQADVVAQHLQGARFDADAGAPFDAVQGEADLMHGRPR